MSAPHLLGRREAIKVGFGALSTLAIGETILLMPSEAEAQLFGKKSPALYTQSPSSGNRLTIRL